MFGTVHLFVALMLTAMGVKETESSAETMKQITSGFLKMLDECKEELGLTNNVIRDFYHYWKEDYELLQRDMGCAIICMSKKLNLLDSSGKFHHESAQEFAMKHGAGDEMASKLVALVHDCEKKQESLEDECVRALEMAKCFRTGIHQLNWAPKMDVIITEVLTEIGKDTE